MTSKNLSIRANRVIPGGVNSPVRAWNAVGGIPIHIERGSGSKLITADGQTLTDYCGSWGPLILGHAHPEVINAVKVAADNGLTFGATTELEIELAEFLCRQIPYFEKVRLVNSGTEATMTALRLAKGYTNRSKIVKFDGCYHGHSDSLLVSGGSGLLTGAIHLSEGISENIIKDTFAAPYNNLEAIESIFKNRGSEIAAIIIEPVAGNMGLVKPEDGFLAGLRRITEEYGALLIFDEVITGFRFGPTTYGTICNVTPDITCLGKIIGGGLPIGALGGQRKIMDKLSPLGNVYQAGTLSGNPIAVTAGITTLKILKSHNVYDRIKQNAQILEGLEGTEQFKNGLCTLAHLDGVFTLFFNKNSISDLEDAKQCDTEKYSRFFHYMLSAGYYIPPSQFEVCFVSAVHTKQEIEGFANAVRGFF